VADSRQGAASTTLPASWVEVLGSVLIVALIALVGEGSARLIRQIGMRAGVKGSALVIVRDVARAIWIVVAIVGVAFYTNLASHLTILALSTVGGLILSLALQATLSNVIAGLLMLQDGTLRVGDEITYSGVKGRVVRITLRTSWIMTMKGDLTVVSNSNLMGGPLTIHTATTRLVPKYHLELVTSPPGHAETGLEIPTEKSPESSPLSSQEPSAPTYVGEGSGPAPDTREA